MCLFTVGFLPELKARWVFVIFLVAIVVPVIPVTILWPDWLESEDLPMPDALAAVLMYLVIAVLLYLSTLRKGVRERFSIGRFPPRQDAVAYALLAIPMISTACLGLMVLWLPLSYLFPNFVAFWVLEAPPIIWWRADTEAVIASILNAALIVVIAPIVEEFAFRGFLLSRWLRKYGAKKAIVLSSMIFAISHIEILGGFVFGVLLSLIYLRTRSLFGPIIVHITNNSIVLLAVVIESLTTGKMGTLTLAEFQGYWWLGPAGAAIGVPWLVWFLRTRIDRLEQSVA